MSRRPAQSHFITFTVHSTVALHQRFFVVHSLSPAAKEGVDDDFGDRLMTRVQLPYSLPK